MGLELFAVKLVLMAVFIERAVAQAKKLARIDWQKPWPLVSALIAGMIVFAWKLYCIEHLIGHGPTNALPVVGVSPFVDWLVSSLILSGGSAFVVDTFKAAARRREEVHQVAIGNAGT